jgi:threonine dehydratase
VIAGGVGVAWVVAARAPPREGGPPPLRGKIVCVVSGGNLDAARLVEILTGSGVGNP